MMFNNNYVNLPLGRQSGLKGKKKLFTQFRAFCYGRPTQSACQQIDLVGATLLLLIP